MEQKDTGLRLRTSARDRPTQQQNIIQRTRLHRENASSVLTKTKFDAGTRVTFVFGTKKKTRLLLSNKIGASHSLEETHIFTVLLRYFTKKKRIQIST
jgi:hypothetical protein